ncbi:MAG: Crp/Fnr family transcriptional regulator [Gammaproteobacteria bacterium]
MSANTARLLLQQNELFHDLPPTALDKITALAHRRHFADGEIIFLKGDPGDSLYGVIAGGIRITSGGADGKQVQLNAFEPGECFGEIALLDGDPRTGTATAEGDTELMVIQRAPLFALLDKEPQLGRHLIALLCQRLRQTARLAEEAILGDVPARLARHLLDLAGYREGNAHEAVEIKVTQANLAQALGTSRQYVNQHLQEWSRQGFLTISRGRIHLRDLAALEAASRAG